MTAPEVKENFPVCTCAGRVFEGQKRRWLFWPPYYSGPIISVHIHPYAMESLLAKICTCMLGRVLGTVKCEKRKKKKKGNLPKVNKYLEGLSSIIDLNHLFTALLPHTLFFQVCISILLQSSINKLFFCCGLPLCHTEFLIIKC